MASLDPACTYILCELDATVLKIWIMQSRDGICSSVLEVIFAHARFKANALPPGSKTEKTVRIWPFETWGRRGDTPDRSAPVRLCSHDASLTKRRREPSNQQKLSHLTTKADRPWRELPGNSSGLEAATSWCWTLATHHIVLPHSSEALLIDSPQASRAPPDPARPSSVT